MAARWNASKRKCWQIYFAYVNNNLQTSYSRDIMSSHYKLKTLTDPLA